MKKLLRILAFIFITLNVNAQQTKNDVIVGKTSTYGNFRGMDIKTAALIKGQSITIGTVVKVDWCEEDCFTLWVKKEDGTMVTVGTKEYGFAVPKKIVGKRIIIEGVEQAKLATQKRRLKKEYQKGIQIAATGIQVFE